MAKRGLLVVIAAALAAFLWSQPAIPGAHATGTAGAEMELLISCGGAQGQCDSSTQTTGKCQIYKGSTVTLEVRAKAVPAGGYVGMQTMVSWNNQLNYVAGPSAHDEIVWPQSSDPTEVRNVQASSVAHGSLTAVGPPFPISQHKGVLVALSFNCGGLPPGNSLLTLEPFDAGANPYGAGFMLPDFTRLAVPSVAFAVDCVGKQPDPGDTDGDGCSDQEENGPDPMLGGQRDWTYFWDFYDVWTHPPNDPGWERNGVINIFDIIQVGMHYGPSPTGGSKDATRAMALTAPPSGAGGPNPAYDRSPRIGPNVWNHGPPDGTINIPDDILGVARVFGHRCV